MKYDIIYLGGYECSPIDHTDSFEEAKNIAKENENSYIYNNKTGVLMDCEGNLVY